MENLHNKNITAYDYHFSKVLKRIMGTREFHSNSSSYVVGEAASIVKEIMKHRETFFNKQ